MRKSLAGKIALITLASIISIVILFPIYWMLTISLRSELTLFDYPPKILPVYLTISGFLRAIQAGVILGWIKNSFVMTAMSVAINLAASSLGAFALSRLDLRGSRFVVFLLLSTQMIAPALIVGPVYIMFAKIKMTNDLLSLAFVNAGLTLAFSTWVMKGLMDDIPREMDEAAHMDGCSSLRLFFSIILPLSISGVITVMVISFFDIYNEFMFALTLITDQHRWLGTVGISSNTTRMGTPWDLMLAQTTLFCVVPIIFYFLFQRYIVRGLTAGAIKF